LDDIVNLSPVFTILNLAVLAVGASHWTATEEYSTYGSPVPINRAYWNETSEVDLQKTTDVIMFGE